MDSLDRAPNDQSVLEGVPNEIGASLEEGIPIGGPPIVDEIGEKDTSGVTPALMLLHMLADTEPSKKRMFNLLLLSTYVPSQEKIHPSTSMVALDPEGALEIIHH